MRWKKDDKLGRRTNMGGGSDTTNAGEAIPLRHHRRNQRTNTKLQLKPLQNTIELELAEKGKGGRGFTATVPKQRRRSASPCWVTAPLGFCWGKGLERKTARVLLMETSLNSKHKQNPSNI